MKTPYQVLEVSADASDDQIKQAYLQKVKDNPPDREQQQFQMIHTAYSSIKDVKSRTRFELFNLPLADFDHLVEQIITIDETSAPNSEQFKQLLSASIDDNTYSNAIASFKK